MLARLDVWKLAFRSSNSKLLLSQAKPRACISHTLMQILQFSHRFDRYRLISIIFKQLSSRIPNFNQGAIETLTGIDQTTISRLLSANGMRKKAKLHRNLNRGHLLVLSRKGFDLSHKDASLILWLAEGPAFSPWRESEFRAFALTPPNPRNDAELNEIRFVNSCRDNPQRAHTEAVELLRKTFVNPRSEDGWHKIGTNILHGNSPRDILALHKKLKDMEYRGGQRMIVSQYPSILVSPELSGASKMLKEAPEPIKGRLLEMLKERKRTFDFNVDRFGERAIHSVSSLKRFVDSSKHPLESQIRRQRLRGLISYLQRYPRFQVGLVPETEIGIEPEIEIAIKSTREAVIRGTGRELSNHPQTIACGPNYLHWDNEWAVITFYLDFETQWEKLARAGHTDHERVITMLNEILST